MPKCEAIILGYPPCSNGAYVISVISEPGTIFDVEVKLCREHFERVSKVIPTVESEEAKRELEDIRPADDED